MTGETLKGIRTFKEPEFGFEQTILFTTIIDKSNSKGKREKDIYEREMEICYMGIIYGMRVYQIFYTKANFNLSHKLKPLTNFLKKLSFVFDELIIGIDDNGKIKEIINLPFLLKRWTVIKTELLNDFGTVEFVQYLTSVDEFFSDTKKIIEHLQLPSMLGMFFHGLHKPIVFEAPEDIRYNYGPETGNLTLNEKIIYSKIDSPINELIEVKISGLLLEEEKKSGKSEFHTNDIIYINKNKENIDKVYSTGRFGYINGNLDHGIKEIFLKNSTKISYSARWVGLKNIFQ